MHRHISMVTRLLDLLFPPRCFGCDSRGSPLCLECREDLPYLAAGACMRCAGRRGLSQRCRGCRYLSPAVSSVHAVCAYEGTARNAVHAFKFRSARYLAPVLGELLRESLTKRPLRADV